MHIFIKAALLSIFLLTGLTACQSEEKYVATIKTPSGGTHEFRVRIADDAQEQTQGLMFVESMPKDEGMLFVYPTYDRRLFWMKNTLIPLDILFFDNQNRLIYIEHNAQPHDETPRGASGRMCSALELNGGTAREMNIEIGSELLIDFPQQCLQSAAE